MVEFTEVRNFFLSKATTVKEQREIRALTESDMKPVSDNLVSALYKSAVEKAHIDFEDIPASRGDITKYKGYVDMCECLDIVERLAIKANTSIKEVNIVKKSIGNIVALRDQFTKGFAIGNQFMMLQYNTLVAACVESTSAIIASYVDYIKTVNAVEFKIINTKISSGNLFIENLEKFNNLVASGDYGKTCNAVLTGATNNILKEGVIAMTAIVLASIAAVVIMMRQIVFKFYYNRMKLSEYLKMQAMFLEMNKTAVQSSGNNLSAAKKKEVLKKQQALADKLNKIADKIKVEGSMADNTSKKEIKKDNNVYTLDDMKQTNIDSIELL